MTDIAALSDVISAIKMPNFSASLAAYLQQQLKFDHLLILGCRKHKHPIYLYDSIRHHRDYLFQRYLTGSYLSDPFYIASLNQQTDSVLRLQDVIHSPYDLKQYQQDFSVKTAVHDELCLYVALDEARWLLLFFGYSSNHQPNCKTDYPQLITQQPLLSALARKHWGNDSFVMSQSSADKNQLQHTVTDALASFGEAVLSKREQEITLLLIQGYDSQDIAALMAITVGTVKNHRKKIYAKLHIDSLSELFRLFLTHLLSS